MDQFFKKILNNFLENIPPWLQVILAFVTVTLVSLSTLSPSSYPEYFPEEVELIITCVHLLCFVLFFLLFIAGIIFSFRNKLLRKPSLKFRGKNVEHYTRVGEHHFDIQVDREINKNLKFAFEILLARDDQDAVLYFEFETNTSPSYWVGFAINVGDSRDRKYETPIERTHHFSSDGKGRYSEEVKVWDTILERFNEFRDSKIIPTKVKTIRLRGSDVVREPVNFFYLLENE